MKRSTECSPQVPAKKDHVARANEPPPRRRLTSGAVLVDVLLCVFGALRREDLEVLQLTNRHFDSIIVSKLTGTGPRRYLGILYIHGYEKYRIATPEYGKKHGALMNCSSNEELTRRLHNSVVRQIEFMGAAMIDEKFFNVLYQLRAVWECGYVNAPNYFASVELFRRSFNELFLCRTLDMSTFGSIDTESDGSDSDESPPKLPEGESPTRLVDFRAVQQCNYLEVYGPNSLWTMTVADVVEWLHGETTKTEWPNKSRCMSVMGGFNDYGPLLEELKKKFFAATIAHPYTLSLPNNYADEDWPEDELYTNETTKEQLRFYVYTGENVVIEREPLE
ncbi:hypothetical protein AAVH_24567 [Aphelenchoides avenae]|nr:hypothetical protein AAVH_24567 [Aphelenchus avenae]